MVMLREQEREAGNIPEDLDEEDEQTGLLDLRKRVKLDEIVGLYATLLDIDSWYYFGVDYDTWIADVLPGLGPNGRDCAKALPQQ